MGNRLQTAPFYPQPLMGLDRMPSPADARNAVYLQPHLYPFAMSGFGAVANLNLSNLAAFFPGCVGPNAGLFPGSPVGSLPSPMSPSAQQLQQQRSNAAAASMMNSLMAASSGNSAAAIAANNHLISMAQLKPGGSAGIADFTAAQIASVGGGSSSGASNGLHRSAQKEAKAAKKHQQQQQPHIKKPLNAFMLYMQEMRPQVMEEVGLKERQSAEINRILGRRWHELSKDEQQKYYDKAKAARQEHIQKHPNWSARDNYAVHKKKKKKRDKSLGNLEMKKCRARFGVDQQDKWCKHCRRKKKCLLFTAELAAQQGYANGGGSEPMDDDDDMSDSLSPEDSPSSSQVSSTTDHLDSHHLPATSLHSQGSSLAMNGGGSGVGSAGGHHMLSSNELIMQQQRNLQGSASLGSSTSVYSPGGLGGGGPGSMDSLKNGGGAGGLMGPADADVRSPLSALVSSTTSMLHFGKSPGSSTGSGSAEHHHLHNNNNNVMKAPSPPSSTHSSGPGSHAPNVHATSVATPPCSIGAYSVESLTRSVVKTEQPERHRDFSGHHVVVGSPGISSSSSLFGPASSRSGSEPSPSGSGSGASSVPPPLLDSTTSILSPATAQSKFAATPAYSVVH